MKQTVKHCAEQLCSAVSRPEVRHSMHYECGLYKSSDARVPMASAQMDHDCALPLIRLLAIIAGIMLAAMAIRSMLCFWRKGKPQKHCCE
jgi:hypothetical protein